MIIYTITHAVRDAVVVALAAHADDPCMGGALGRVAREDSPPALAAFIKAWPEEADGRFRIALSDIAGALVWRAYAIAEIDAGRGRLSVIDEYAALFCIDHPRPAFEYVSAQMRGTGIRPYATADRDSWTAATEWVVRDGDMEEPQSRWSRDAWYSRISITAHSKYVGAGLAVAGRDPLKPLATMLFVTPTPVQPPVALAAADDAALMMEFS